MTIEELMIKYNFDVMIKNKALMKAYSEFAVCTFCPLKEGCPVVDTVGKSKSKCEHHLFSVLKRGGIND